MGEINKRCFQIVQCLNIIVADKWRVFALVCGLLYITRKECAYGTEVA